MLVSVVLPVYNQELYLRNALNLVLNQTFSEIEVIAVDDGSTDSSLAILQEIASQDRRLKIVHQNNEGLLSANVSGIKAAVGDYLCFMDPDDIIGKNYIESFISELDRPYDFIARGITYRYPDSSQSFPLAADKVLDKSEIIGMSNSYILSRSMALDNKIFIARWNKLYRTELLNSFVSEYAACAPVSFGEDSLFTYLLLQHACLGKTCASLCSYEYVQHEKSMTNNTDYHAVIQECDLTFKTFVNLVEKHSNDITPALLLYYSQLSGCLSRIVDNDYQVGHEMYECLQSSERYRAALDAARTYSKGRNINLMLQFYRCPFSLYAAARHFYQCLHH